jgi:hypothetical protein
MLRHACLHVAAAFSVIDPNDAIRKDGEEVHG